MEGSQIAEFYSGKSVFITGGTGFVGKALIEKLIRSCPGIEKVYILLRPMPRKNKSIQQRFTEFLNIEVFENIRKEDAGRLQKIVPINGDISLPQFGISDEDERKLIDEVSVVFHCAARVRFDDDLKAALDSNVSGPKRMAELCRKMPLLKAFVHVSTTFHNLHKSEIEEVIYPTNVDPVQLVDLADSMDKELLSKLCKPLIGDSPNVYAYTKALGEQILLKESIAHGLPLAVVRPSTITPALREPLPGWTDNLNGPTGIVLGCGKGVLRCIPANANTVGDLIPVDYVVNLMLAAAWKRANTSGSAESLVFNCATGSMNPITWAKFRDIGNRAWGKFPTKEMMWYPKVTCYSNHLHFVLVSLLLHFIPAVLIDLVMKFQGRKAFMVRTYQKIHTVLGALAFYSNQQWKFVTKNLVQLSDSMRTVDRETFYFDVRDIHWESYIDTFIQGVRMYMLKDPMDTLPVAKRNLLWMYVLKILANLVLLGLATALFVKLFAIIDPIKRYSSVDIMDGWSIPISSLNV